MNCLLKFQLGGAGLVLAVGSNSNKNVHILYNMYSNTKNNQVFSSICWLGKVMLCPGKYVDILVGVINLKGYSIL